jgi:ATP-dependent Clp protease ATP-binding subunit ClpB
MTSNLASEEIAEYGLQQRKEAEEVAKAGNSGKIDDTEMTENVPVSRHFKEEVIRPILKRHFKRDEFLGRISETVYFFPFSTSEINQLVVKILEIWAKRAKEEHKIKLTWDNKIIELIAKEYNIREGARSIKRQINRKIIDNVVFGRMKNRIKAGDHVYVTVVENIVNNKRNEEIKFKVNFK